MVITQNTINNRAKIWVRSIKYNTTGVIDNISNPINPKLPCSASMRLISLWEAAFIPVSSNQTGGLIEKRYTNENARGVEKEDVSSGRGELAATEWEMFMDNPYLGVGVGRNKEIRLEETGIAAATHSEISRMLAEHGSLGLLGLLILSVTPVVLYMSDRTQIFALLFMVFWALTINHAAMRIAAPAFVYALALLKVYFPKEGEAPMA